MGEELWQEPTTAWVHLTLQEGMFTPREARAVGPGGRRAGADGSRRQRDPSDGGSARGVRAPRSATCPSHAITHVELAGWARRVHLFYTPPYGHHTTGNLGPEPQPFESKRYLGIVALIIVAGYLFQALLR